MERWTALLPDRANSGTIRDYDNPRLPPPPRLIGRLPAEAYIAVLAHLPIPDIPQFARCSRACARLARDDRLWRRKLEWLDYKGPGQVEWRAPFGAVTDQVVQSPTTSTKPNPFKPPPPAHSSRPISAHKQSLLGATDIDEFGDFLAAGPEHEPVATAGSDDDDEFGDFNGHAQGFGDFQEGNDFGGEFSGLDQRLNGLEVGGLRKSVDQGVQDLMMMFDDDDTNPIPKTPTSPVTSTHTSFKPTLGINTAPVRPPALAQLTFDNSPSPVSPQAAATSSLLAVFKLHHAQLLPYYISLLAHTTSSLLFTQSTLTPRLRALLLASLARFVEPEVAPTRSLPQRLTAKRNIGAAADFFEAALLAEFNKADERDDEAEMKGKVEILVELNGGLSAVQVFVQKREMLSDAGYDPLQNLT